ncbi:hypothetical protein PO909_017132 [Leuciscus waleckii]
MQNIGEVSYKCALLDDKQSGGRTGGGAQAGRGVTVRTASLSLHCLIFSLYPPSKARGPMKAQVEDLRKQLKAKSRIIQSLKEEIKTPLFQNAQKKNEAALSFCDKRQIL